MSEIKLLPCPFCGGENIKVLGSETSYYWCRCMNCLASTTTEDVEEDAIKAWNTRKPIEKVVDRLEEMFKHHSATETVKRLVLETVKGSGTDDKELKLIEKE